MIILDVGSGGARVSRRILAERAGWPLQTDAPGPVITNTLTRRHVDDIVNVTRIGERPHARRAYYNSEATRADRPGFVLHPLVDPAEHAADGEGVGFAGGTARHKNPKFARAVMAQTWRDPITPNPASPMSDFYRRLAWLIVPSLDEAYSRIIVEAAAHGVAVLASNIGGMAETGCATHLPFDVDQWVRVVNSEPDRESALHAYQQNRERQDAELAAFKEWIDARDAGTYHRRGEDHL